MPKILITGNGFDLSLGLPTSYSDFINVLNSLKNCGEVDFHSVYSNSSNYDVITEKHKVFSFNYEKIETLKIEIQNNL